MRRTTQPHFAAPQADVEGYLTLWQDQRADVIFVTVGPRRDAYHEYLGQGIALRFDAETHQCVGWAMIGGMIYEGPFELPLHVALTHDPE